MQQAAEIERVAPRGLSARTWFACAVYASVVTGVVCYAVWPGFMSYDSLFAYEEGRYGIQTMLWPPLHAYMFWLSDRLGVGPGGLLAAQTFVLFWAAALTLCSLIASRALAGLLCLGFAVSFAVVPTQLGTLIALWRDVTTASFALLALALWLQAAALRSRPLLIAALVSVGVALALRYNAVALLFPLMLLMVWRPLLSRPAATSDRAVVLVGLALAVGLAWASTQWRLPDFVKMPPPDNFGGTQEFDLIGVSACAGRNYIPLAVSSGSPLTLAQIRAVYDPRHLQSTLAPHPGVPRLLETDAGGQVKKRWGQLVRSESGCYLAHRMLVLTEQLGMAAQAPFYPVHTGIDPNRFHLELARPGPAGAIRDYVLRNAGEPLRRPYLLYLAALPAAVLAIWLRRDLGTLILALLAGIFGYLALLFLAAPAADARYIFPSNTLAALVILIALGLLVEQGRQESGRPLQRPA